MEASRTAFSWQQGDSSCIRTARGSRSTTGPLDTSPLPAVMNEGLTKLDNYKAVQRDAATAALLLPMQLLPLPPPPLPTHRHAAHAPLADKASPSCLLVDQRPHNSPADYCAKHHRPGHDLLSGTKRQVVNTCTHVRRIAVSSCGCPQLSHKSTAAAYLWAQHPNSNVVLLKVKVPRPEGRQGGGREWTATQERNRHRRGGCTPAQQLSSRRSGPSPPATHFATTAMPILLLVSAPPKRTSRRLGCQRWGKSQSRPSPCRSRRRP